MEHYSEVSFAVILLTPDDVGASAASREELCGRARQNVVLELGYFVGKLGRNNVCVLAKQPIELPSDILGIVYVTLDPDSAWQLRLARELKEAGVEFDINDAL